MKDDVVGFDLTNRSVLCKIGKKGGEMDLGLREKTVIVTGGGSNIGRGISLTFGQEGANVIVAEIDEAQGNKVAGVIKAKGGNAVAIKTDVTNLDSVKSMADETLKTFGKIDVLVNNVGWDMFQLFAQTTPEFWDKVIALNYRSVLNCISVVLPHMIERKYGRVVNIGSDAGRVGEFRESVYSGTKGAVIALTKALARENGRYGITFNVACPGGATHPEKPEEEASKQSMWAPGSPALEMLTPETVQKIAANYPLRRLCTPQDIANAVVFLASDAASYITGQTLSVTGGYSMM